MKDNGQVSLQDNEPGYRECACRDCFEIAIGTKGALCFYCEDAECSSDGNEECHANDAGQA